MSENKTPQQKRRQIIKTVGASVPIVGIVPGEWSKPLVNAVVLPAHAVTTDETIVLGSSDPLVIANNSSFSPNQWKNILMSEAYAESPDPLEGACLNITYWGYNWANSSAKLDARLFLVSGGKDLVVVDVSYNNGEDLSFTVSGLHGIYTVNGTALDWKTNVYGYYPTRVTGTVSSTSGASAPFDVATGIHECTPLTATTTAAPTTTSEPEPEEET